MLSIYIDKSLQQQRMDLAARQQRAAENRAAQEEEVTSKNLMFNYSKMIQRSPCSQAKKKALEAEKKRKELALKASLFFFWYYHALYAASAPASGGAAYWNRATNKRSSSTKGKIGSGNTRLLLIIAPSNALWKIFCKWTWHLFWAVQARLRAQQEEENRLRRLQEQV